MSEGQLKMCQVKDECKAMFDPEGTPILERRGLGYL